MYMRPRWLPRRNVCIKVLLLKEKLQKEREMLPASSVLSSDLPSKLDKKEDEREVIKVMEGAPQVLPLKGKQQNSVTHMQKVH